MILGHESGDWHDIWLTAVPLAVSALVFLQLRSRHVLASTQTLELGDVSVQRPKLRTPQPHRRPPAESAGGSPFDQLRRLLSLYRSSVGRKFVMALSGLAITGFVVVHLIGTLKIFLGPEETNHYGEALRGLGGDLVPHGHLLWILRIGLLLAFAIHLHAAFSLDRRNRAARGPSGRQPRRYSAASYASRTMLWSGIIVGLFIVFHIADLTWGATSDEFVVGEVYDNQIRSFSNPWISGVYLAALVALVAHLHHGLASLVPSLGGRAPWLTEKVRKRIALVVAAAIGAGYASIPIAVLVGALS